MCNVMLINGVEISLPKDVHGDACVQSFVNGYSKAKSIIRSSGINACNNYLRTARCYSSNKSFIKGLEKALDESKTVVSINQFLI